MKKDTKTKIQPVLVEETGIGDLIRIFNDDGDCSCLFIRIENVFFDDDEQGKANVTRVDLCNRCVKKAGILRVEPEFMMYSCYIPYGTSVVYHEKVSED